MNAKSDAWIHALRTKGERLRLFCFPYAGGGPYIFQKWSKWLPEHVGLYAVHLPGRGTRIWCPPVGKLHLIVAAVVKALQPLQDIPFVFFGHSMGALLAFETARALRRQCSCEPRLLLVSACRPPSMIEQRERICNLSDEAFIQKIKDLGGTPPEVLENKELLEILLPTLRADFSVIDTYRYESAAPLICPIAVISGAQDHHACGPIMAGWNQETSHTPLFYEIQGGHFFIHTADAELQRIIVSKVGLEKGDQPLKPRYS